MGRLVKALRLFAHFLSTVGVIGVDYGILIEFERWANRINTMLTPTGLALNIGRAAVGGAVATPMLAGKAAAGEDENV